MQLPGPLSTPSSKKIKKSPPKKASYTSGNGTFQPAKILIKPFYTLNKAPLRKTGCLSSLYYLLTAQASSFLIHFPFLNTVSKAILSSLHFTVQYLCDLRYTMPCHWSPSTSHPTLPREAGDFPSSGKYPKDVPLPTFLAYL